MKPSLDGNFRNGGKTILVLVARVLKVASMAKTEILRKLPAH
ncbi:hypothetical protein RUM8411_02604 [Ruegeria meonggei]|uniref:Uncharacterized protein n=1 Tax=Ruegeria meonggei TaxID=1446476 RepID=A0A1X6ZKA1_9RHOB|nr:hypothetical protein RUM8411_02604 [Ruegeria meonggei]